MGLWCPECGDFCCPPPQPIDMDEPGEPMPAVPRDGKRWLGNKKVPIMFEEIA